MRRVLVLLLALGGASCAHSAAPGDLVSLRAQDWIGVYASPGEISGFAGTVLALQVPLLDDHPSGEAFDYRMRRYSDVSSADMIEQDEEGGNCRVEGHTLYLPEAWGFMSNGKPKLQASLERFTRVEMNGHVVLMRDDAYKAYVKDNRLYDYGILVRVSDKADFGIDLRKVQRPSIKLLYADPDKPWHDPFVHGPNER